MATEVDDLLKELWMVVSHLRRDQTEWLARQQWTFARTRCSQIIETSQKQRLAIGVVAPPRTGTLLSLHTPLWTPLRQELLD